MALESHDFRHNFGIFVDVKKSRDRARELPKKNEIKFPIYQILLISSKTKWFKNTCLSHWRCENVSTVNLLSGVLNLPQESINHTRAELFFFMSPLTCSCIRCELLSGSIILLVVWSVNSVVVGRLRRGAMLSASEGLTWETTAS